MNFAVLRRPRTQALLDGAVKPAGYSARWLPLSDPLGWALSPREKHRDLGSGEFEGGEMSISSFVQAKSQGAPLVALPIFLKRGLAQRSLFCPASSSLTSPEQLVGKRVGLVNYTSSMAVWMRGILSDGYGIAPSTIQWFALSGVTEEPRSLKIPAEFAPERIRAWEELDGYPHDLDRRESFLLSLLDRGELDAVVSFQAKIDRAGNRPLLDEDSLWSLPFNSQIYPINHLFVIKLSILNEHPSLAESLRSAFAAARKMWTSYQSPDERKAFDSEMARLRYDPFAYRLGEVEKTSLERFVGYLERELLISAKLGLDELFNGAA